MSLGNINEYLHDPNINLVRLADNSVIPERVARIIDIIEERWQGRVQVNWIPKQDVRAEDNQFCLVEVLPDGREYPIFWVKDESEFDGSVLERLIAADNSEGNVLDRLQAKNAAVREIEKSLAREQMAEAHDMASSAFRSPLNWYRLGKGRVIRDQGNRTR